jgi:hypothetical protein
VLQSIQVANIAMISPHAIPHVVVAMAAAAATVVVAATMRANKKVVEVIVTTTAIITAIEIRRSTRILLITSHANDRQAHENVHRIQYDTEHGPPVLKQFTPHLRQVVWLRNLKLEKLRKYDGKENPKS